MQSYYYPTGALKGNQPTYNMKDGIFSIGHIHISLKILLAINFSELSKSMLQKLIQTFTYKYTFLMGSYLLTPYPYLWCENLKITFFIGRKICSRSLE